jgi:antitoxin YefM
MESTLSISEARAKFLDLADSLGESREVLQVTRRGKPVLAVLPWDVYESLLETLEVMVDPEAMAAIREDMANPGRTDGISWEEAKKEIGW